MFTKVFLRGKKKFSLELFKVAKTKKPNAHWQEGGWKNDSEIVFGNQNELINRKKERKKGEHVLYALNLRYPLPSQ